MTEIGLSRRVVLASAGAVVVGFTLGGSAGAASPVANAWIKVGADGRVGLFTGKAELGQGILTALAQIAADELDVSLDRIDITSADTELSPDEGYTFGSLSVEQGGMAVRSAAATVRGWLLDHAATVLHSDALTVADGVVMAPRASIGYGELAARFPYDGGVAKGAAPKLPAARRVAGRAAPRVDIPAKAFGEARFIHDLRLPQMLHGRVLRGPTPDARLDGVDLSVVRGMAVEIVRDGAFLGVLAEREEVAVRAVEALRAAARWRPTPQLPDQAKLADFIFGHQDAIADVVVEKPAALAPDARRFGARYFRPYQAHASIGPSLAVARMDGDGFTIWTHSQGVFPLRGAIAEALALPPEKLRLIHQEGAGCYGHNGADDAALDAALLARAAGGRPVRLQWMRQDEFRHEPYGAAMVVALDAALADDGAVLDWRHDVWGFSHSTRPGGKAGNLLAARAIEPGFAAPTSRPFSYPKGGLDRNAIPLYDFPALKITKHFIPQSPLRVSALRGLGAYANVFALESFIDELAHHAGRDPVEYRLAHMNDPRAREVIKTAAKMAGWGAALPKGVAGRGFAFARYKNHGGYLGVVVEVAPGEKIEVVRALAAVDCGEVINPDGVKNQVEGGIIQSLSWTLLESVNFAGDRVSSEDWSGYPILGHDQAPKIEVTLIDRPDQPPLGAGEVAQGPMAAAVANAWFAATGARLRDLPLNPEQRGEG